jgi:hypothetical protein
MSPFMLLSKVTHALSWDRADPRSVEREAENYRIGPYKADYSEPELSAWRAVDPELEELIANSRSILDGSDAR